MVLVAIFEDGEGEVQFICSNEGTPVILSPKNSKIALSPTIKSTPVSDQERTKAQKVVVAWTEARMEELKKKSSRMRSLKSDGAKLVEAQEKTLEAAKAADARAAAAKAVSKRKKGFEEVPRARTRGHLDPPHRTLLRGGL